MRTTALLSLLTLLGTVTSAPVERSPRDPAAPPISLDKRGEAVTIPIIRRAHTEEQAHEKRFFLAGGIFGGHGHGHGHGDHQYDDESGCDECEEDDIVPTASSATGAPPVTATVGGAPPVTVTSVPGGEGDGSAVSGAPPVTTSALAGGGGTADSPAPPVTPVSSSSAQIHPTGQASSVALDNTGNVLYFAPIEIGTPPQKFEVQIDTGSNGMWVHSTECTQECPAVPGFDRTKSSTFATDGASFRQNYVTTKVSGHVVRDQVSMGGYTVNQDFGIAVNASSTNSAGKEAVGIMGLGWPLKSGGGKFPNSRPFWQNALLGAGGTAWPAPRFGMQLTPIAKDASEGAGGKLTLGGVDGSAIAGGETGLIYVATVKDEPEEWQVKMRDLVIGGQSVFEHDGVGASVGARATLDSGTSGLMGPLEAVKKIYEQIPGSFVDQLATTEGVLEYYRYPCDAAPDVQVNFGGTAYKINDDDLYTYKGTYNSSTEVTCRGNIFGFNRDYWVIGDAFFHVAYVAFQYDPPAIGFGKLAKAKA